MRVPNEQCLVSGCLVNLASPLRGGNWQDLMPVGELPIDDKSPRLALPMDEVSQPARFEWPVIVFACVWPAIFTYVVFVSLVNSAEAAQQWADGLGKAIQFGLPLVWVGLIRGGRLRWPRPNTCGLATGIGFGLLVAGSMLALYFGYFKHAGIFDAAHRK